METNLLVQFNQVFFPHVVKLSKDVNGNHIIIKFVCSISYPNNSYIYEIILNSIYEVATDKHGCCVLQKCIEFANDNQMVNLFDYYSYLQLILENISR